MSDASTAFANTNTSPGDFGLVLGRMLLKFGELTPAQFNMVGSAQARTLVIAQEFNRQKPETHQVILEKFGKRKDRGGPLTGELDMNGAMFGYNETNIVPELDSFIETLRIPDLDAKMQKAREVVSLEEGVPADAAASAVIIKSLFLKRDERQAVVDASLIMQFVTRGLERVEAIRQNKISEPEAAALSARSNKPNPKDPLAVRIANQSLVSICSTEALIALAFQENPQADVAIIREEHETLLHANMRRLLKSIPEATKLFEMAGRTNLAAKAREAESAYHAQFAETFLIRKPEPPTATIQ